MVPVCKVKIRPHRKTLVAVKAGRFARLEELGRDAKAPFRRGSNLFELTWQARERERGGHSGSKKEMSHPRWMLAGTRVSTITEQAWLGAIRELTYSIGFRADIRGKQGIKG